MTSSIKSRFIFDSPGRYFNKEGEIIDNWWSNYTSQGFDTRAQCMVNQYNKYPVDGGTQGQTHVSHVWRLFQLAELVKHMRFFLARNFYGAHQSFKIEENLSSGV